MNCSTDRDMGFLERISPRRLDGSGGWTSKVFYVICTCVTMGKKKHASCLSFDAHTVVVYQQKFFIWAAREAPPPSTG